MSVCELPEQLTPEEAAAAERYQAAMHGVQSAVAYLIETGGESGTSGKSLRVGVNAAMVDTAAVAELLMAKGVITRLEYFQALAVKAEEELERYQAKAPAGVRFA